MVGLHFAVLCTIIYVFDVVGVFDVLVYTDKDLDVPDEWGESGACMITNSVQVKLRSFSTTVHKVDAMVAYKDE